MTLFQKIIAGEIPADIVYEDDHVVAFRDIAPVAPTHVLIIPRKPIPSLAEATAEDLELLGRVLLAARHVAQLEGVADAGYRLVLNTGVHGGQTVMHLHLHLLAGRELSWPPG